MKAKLEPLGFDTVFASSAGEAVKCADEYMPDLILMDIFMPPGVNGTDVALAIKQHPKTKNIKIAFLSSMKDPWPGAAGANKNVSKELGMDDFLEKTEDLDITVGRIREILAR
jgi:CheY-like chemotaxis protein